MQSPIAFWQGEYLPLDQVHIEPDDRGFLFADSLYEVIRAYDGRLFRPHAHLQRLAHGARALRFHRNDFSQLEEVAVELLARNSLTGKGDASVYFQVTRGAAPRSHSFPDPDTPLSIFARARPFEPRHAEHEGGISAILTPDLRWARCDIKTTGLTANVLASQLAADRGAGEALFVRDGVVVEGTHTNLVAVIDGELVTHPRTNVILPGVTLEAVLAICEREGLPVRQRPLRVEELLPSSQGVGRSGLGKSQAPSAQELFVVGTTTELMPLISLEGEQIGDGKPGPLTRRIQEIFYREVRSPGSWIFDEAP